MTCGVTEAFDLLVLREQVRDGVVDEIDQGELAGNDGRGHVPDDHRERVLVDLAPQHRCHVLGQFDAHYRHAAFPKRDPHSSGPDGELQCPAVSGQLGKEGESRSESGGRGRLSLLGVVAVGGRTGPQLTARHGRPLCRVPRGAVDAFSPRRSVHRPRLRPSHPTAPDHQSWTRSTTPAGVSVPSPPRPGQGLADYSSPPRRRASLISLSLAVVAGVRSFACPASRRASSISLSFA